MQENQRVYKVILDDRCHYVVRQNKLPTGFEFAILLMCDLDGEEIEVYRADNSHGEKPHEHLYVGLSLKYKRYLLEKNAGPALKMSIDYVRRDYVHLLERYIIVKEKGQAL